MSLLLHGLALLQAFGPEDTHGITFTELAARVDAPRSTIFRALSDLERAGFIRRDAAKRYYLGARVITLGYTYLASQDVMTIARPELMRLRDRTGCSSYLSVLDGADILYLAHFAAQRPVLGVVTIGARIPAYSTPMGRAMLAHLRDADLEIVYQAQALRQFSPGLPATLFDLRSDLITERARGFSYGTTFFSPGVMSIAAPLLNRDGEVLGAISAASLDIPVGHEYDASVAASVCEAARSIAALLP